MKKRMLSIAAFLVLGAAVAGLPALAESSVSAGFGGHYWRTLDDLGTSRDFDRDGVGWTVSLRLNMSRWVGLEGAVEMLPEGFLGADQRVYAPHALLVVGRSLFVAAGAGVFYMGGSFYDDPFYFCRGGLSLELLPMVSVDIYGDYRFTHWDDVETILRDIDTETVTLGAAVRVGF